MIRVRAGVMLRPVLRVIVGRRGLLLVLRRGLLMPVRMVVMLMTALRNLIARERKRQRRIESAKFDHVSSPASARVSLRDRRRRMLVQLWSKHRYAAKRYDAYA